MIRSVVGRDLTESASYFKAETAEDGGKISANECLGDSFDPASKELVQKSVM